MSLKELSKCAIYFAKAPRFCNYCLCHISWLYLLDHLYFNLFYFPFIEDSKENLLFVFYTFIKIANNLKIYLSLIPLKGFD